MRTALLVISGLVAVFFAVAFSLTFFTRGHLIRLAEDYVIDRTRPHADKLVEVAEQAVKTPGANLVLGEEVLQATRRELAEYRDDPRAYIARLVAANDVPAAADPGKDAPLKVKVLFWKDQIRSHFEKTLDQLLFDLRIFAGSNLVAALLAFGLAWRARPDRLRALLFVAGLLLASMAFTAYAYVDHMSYFKILMNSYMGWWYPALLALTFLGMVVEYGQTTTRTGQRTGSRSVTIPGNDPPGGPVRVTNRRPAAGPDQ